MFKSAGELHQQSLKLRPNVVTNEAIKGQIFATAVKFMDLQLERVPYGNLALHAFPLFNAKILRNLTF